MGACVRRGGNAQHLGSNGASTSHLKASHRQGAPEQGSQKSNAAATVEGESNNQGKLLGILGLVAGVAVLFGAGFFFKDKVAL